MLFKSINKLFGILTIRKKILITILFLFIIIVSLAYKMNYKMFYDKFDNITISIVDRNSDFISALIRERIQLSKLITRTYADDYNIVNKMRAGRFNELYIEFDQNVLREFDIEYLILSQNGKFVHLENTAINDQAKIIEFLSEFSEGKPEVLDVDKNYFFDNIYIDSLNKSIIYVCAVPIQYRSIVNSYEKVGRLITITRLRMDSIYSVFQRAFNISTKEFHLYEVIDSELPVENDPNMKIFFDRYLENTTNNSMIFKDEINPNEYIRYLLFDQYKTKVLLKMDVTTPVFSVTHSEEFMKSVQEFDILCVSLLLFTCLTIFTVLNHVLSKLRLMTKILIFINTSSRVSPEDLANLQKEVDSINHNDDYGKLLAEFNEFLSRNQQIYVEDKSSYKLN